MAHGNRNQHWVPQFYLRQFATADTKLSRSPQVWSFPVKDGEEFRANVRNVAAKRDLYSKCDPQVDAKLSDLEDMLGGFWPTLSDFYYPINDGFKKGVGLFLATLFLRHPKELQRQRRFAESVSSALSQGPVDNNGHTLIDSLKAGGTVHSIESKELEHYQNITEEGIHKLWGESILGETGIIAKGLVDRAWSAIVSYDPVFITSDHPVALNNPGRQDAPILHSGTSIYFPMTPHKLIVINSSNRDDGKCVWLPKGRESAFNWCVYGSADQHVFCPWEPIKLWQQMIRFSERARSMERRAIAATVQAKTGRNDRCPCGSGLKYKKCCAQV